MEEEVVELLRDILHQQERQTAAIERLESMDTRLAALEKGQRILLDNLPLLQEVHASAETQAAVKVEKARVGAGIAIFLQKASAPGGFLSKEKTA